MRAFCQIAGSRVFTHMSPRLNLISLQVFPCLPFTQLLATAGSAACCRCRCCLAGPGPRWPELQRQQRDTTHTTPAPLPGPSSAQIAALGTWNAKQRKKVRDQRQLQANNPPPHSPHPRTVRLVSCQVTAAMSAAQLLNPKAESRVCQVTIGLADWGQAC
jgi:hypothetical protein